MGTGKGLKGQEGAANTQGACGWRVNVVKSYSPHKASLVWENPGERNPALLHSPCRLLLLTLSCPQPWAQPN